MSEEKSTEEQNIKITAIVGSEALGYTGSGREELSGRSGEDDAKPSGKLGDDLADNNPGDL
ncbi:MAG TPA: hypothetical protein VEK79_07305 [Thermoanaerobaculia bacterium]|nr:hypothetical protein [Thermoanaerobaculia bacterium]